MKPKISIIIPVYNGEKTLRECLDSILKQTYKDYEIIVVDNNSTDKTKEIIEELQEKNKSKDIRYLFEAKRGRGSARRKGETNANGEIILMTDSDCIVPKNWIEKIVNAIEKYDGVQGFELPVYNNFWSEQRQLRSEKKYKKGDMKNPIGKIDTKNFAIKKNVLKKIGFTSRKYFSGNDTELSIRLAKNNCKIRFMKNIKVRHFHPDSLREVFKKQVYRGEWTVTISKDNRQYLKKTDFLKETCQTFWSFFKFFPGIFGTLIREGFNYAFYDFIAGIAWRIGLLKGWLRK